MVAAASRMRAAATVEAATAHSVRAASTMEALASMESPVTATGESAVIGMPRPTVDSVIDVVVVVSFMVRPITKVPVITEVVPTAKVTKVVKIMVEVAEEKNRCEAHVKR